MERLTMMSAAAEISPVERRKPAGQRLRNLVVAGNVLQELLSAQLEGATGEARERMHNGIQLWELALEAVRSDIQAKAAGERG